MSTLYRPFLERLPPGGTILDAGCGSGRDTLAFTQRGFLVTAFDASAAMVEAATRLTGVPIQHMRFQEMQFTHAFDGIWACASLLHVPKRDIPDVFTRCIRALKPHGVWYMSFKRGEGEAFDAGRLFNSYTEASLQRTLAGYETIAITSLWVTHDIRPERSEETWVNIIVQRTE
jgi:2-polyprenyl-3-methyl-5-hydroxy-6-metoxy-1,4-benzoquinol methylase